MLSTLYPLLRNGADYKLSTDGTQIVSWTPHQANFPIPNVGTLPAQYANYLTQHDHATKIQAATHAVDALWNSLTDAQKVPLLNERAALRNLSEDTGAKKLVLAGLETSIATILTGANALTTEQHSLLTAASAAVNALT
jgi:hypothetical protein